MDGKIWLGVPSGLIRRNTHGSQEIRFVARINPPPPSGPPVLVTNPPAVYSIAVQTNGKILIGGIFNTANGVERHGLARLNSDSSLDMGFDPGQGVGVGGPSDPNAYVNSVMLQADGKVLVGGPFL